MQFNETSQFLSDDFTVFFENAHFIIKSRKMNRETNVEKDIP